MAQPVATEVYRPPTHSSSRTALTFEDIGIRTLELLTLDDGVDEYASWAMDLSQTPLAQSRLVGKIVGANQAIDRAPTAEGRDELESLVTRLFAGNLAEVLGIVLVVDSEHSSHPLEELIIDSNHLAADWFKRTYIRPYDLSTVPEAPTPIVTIGYLYPLLSAYSRNKIDRLPFSSEELDSYYSHRLTVGESQPEQVADETNQYDDYYEARSGKPPRITNDAEQDEARQATIRYIRRHAKYTSEDEVETQRGKPSYNLKLDPKHEEKIRRLNEEVVRYTTGVESIPQSMRALASLAKALKDMEGVDRSWMAKAACLGANTDEFFPSSGKLQNIPKKICSGCDVRPECLDYAIRTGVAKGVWGGTSERERRNIRREAAKAKKQAAQAAAQAKS